MPNEYETGPIPYRVLNRATVKYPMAPGLTGHDYPAITVIVLVSQNYCIQQQKRSYLSTSSRTAPSCRAHGLSEASERVSSLTGFSRGVLKVHHLSQLRSSSNINTELIT